MAHVFISYVRENAAFVNQLVDELRRRGVNVWIDRDQIEPGERWRTAIKRAINSGALFVACFSREWATRGESYMNEEIGLAVDELKARRTGRGWFIPVQFDGTEVPALSIGGHETLRDLQWLDGARTCDELARDIGRAAVQNAMQRVVSGDATRPEAGLSRLEYLRQVLHNNGLGPYSEVRNALYDSLERVVQSCPFRDRLHLISATIEEAQQHVTLYGVNYYWDEVAIFLQRLMRHGFILRVIGPLYQDFPLQSQGETALVSVALKPDWRLQLESELIIALVKASKKLSPADRKVIAELLQPPNFAWNEDNIQEIVDYCVRVGPLAIASDGFIEESEDCD